MNNDDDDNDDDDENRSVQTAHKKLTREKESRLH